jgi:hypothetical protein
LISNIIRIPCSIVTNGFSTQAAILTSTIYELSHKGIFVFNNPIALQVWGSLHNNFELEFDKELGKAMKPGQKNPKINLKEIIKDNITKAGSGTTDLEYGVYEQLCKFKHPHPALCRLLTNGKIVFALGGNRSDNQAIQHSWFVA